MEKLKELIEFYYFNQLRFRVQSMGTSVKEDLELLITEKISKQQLVKKYEKLIINPTILQNLRKTAIKDAAT